MSGKCGFNWSTEGKRLMERIGSLGNISIQVGFKGEDADAAMYAEYGTSHAPARPFMSTALNKHSADIQVLMNELINEYLNGSISKDEIAKRLGEAVKGYIADELSGGSFAPSAQSTVNERGPDLPLSGLKDKIVVIIGGLE